MSKDKTYKVSRIKVHYSGDIGVACSPHYAIYQTNSIHEVTCPDCKESNAYKRDVAQQMADRLKEDPHG